MIYSENILICIAIPLLIALVFTKRSTRRFIISFILGMLVCLIAAYISGFIKVVLDTSHDDIAVFYSPLIEEILKLLPLLFYMFIFYPHNNEIFIMALGLCLGFATFENCCYILSAGASSMAYVLIRGMAVGVMHLVCILLLVLGLCSARFFKVFSLASVIGSLSLSVTFHGLYNLLVSNQGISSYLGYFLPLVTAGLLYIPYRKLTGNRSEE